MRHVTLLPRCWTLLLVLLVAGCGAPEEEPQATGEPTAAVDEGLVGTTWQLVELEGERVPDDAEATLSFPEVGRAAGSGSCNRFTGPVEVVGDSVGFGPLGATRRACEEGLMELEARYFRALEGARRFAVEGEALRMYGEGQGPRLHLVRQARRDSVAASAGSGGGEPAGLTDRVWVRTDSTGRPGVMRVFLTDGTLLMDSCWETYRLARWTRAGDVVSWEEDGATVEAAVLSVSGEELRLRLRLPSGPEGQRYAAARVPYVCPDVPR